MTQKNHDKIMKILNKADVLVYADDVGIFEIGNTRSTKMILLLKFIARLDSPFAVHFLALWDN